MFGLSGGLAMVRALAAVSRGLREKYVNGRNCMAFGKVLAKSIEFEQVVGYVGEGWRRLELSTSLRGCSKQRQGLVQIYWHLFRGYWGPNYILG